MVGRNTIAHEKASQFEILAPSREELDLSKFSDLVAFLIQNRPDIIIHAAGKVGGIKANMAGKKFTEDVNVSRNLWCDESY